MLANPNYMAFYPTNLFHLFLPFNYAFKLHFIVHPLLGGLGLYFLQRRLGLLPLAAFGGSVAYQFSGPVLSFLNLYNLVPAVALMPWLGWAFIAALNEKGWKRSLVFGGVLALQFTAFEPLMFQCGFLLLAGLAIYYLLESENRPRGARKVFLTGCIGLGTGLMLAAVQIIPTLELLPLSARFSGYGLGIRSWSMHPADFINLLIPNLFGTPYTMYRTTYWGELFHDMRESYLVSFFIGAGTAILVLASFLSARKRLRRVMIGLTLFGSILALGKFLPWYFWLYDHLPFFRLGRYPSKYFFLATLGLAVLCSLGLEAILSAEARGAERRRRCRWLGAFAISLAAACMGLWLWASINPQTPEGFVRSRLTPETASIKDFPVILAQLMDAVRLSGTFLLLSGALVLLSTLQKRSRYLGELLVVVLVAELASSNLRLSPLIDDADVNFVSEVNSYLQQQASDQPHRVFSLDSLRSTSPTLRVFTPQRSWAWFTFFYRMSGQPMYGIMSGIQYSIDQGVDFLNTLESESLSKLYLKLPEADALTLLSKLNTPIVLSLGEIRDSRLVLMKSFDALASDPLRVYELQGALPRAYFIAGVQHVPSQIDALSRFSDPGFQYRDTLLLEGPHTNERSGMTDAGATRIIEYSSTRVACEVDARTAGYLVLLDSYYPGWRAYCDGEPVEILRANYAFRAVRVPAGSHRVELLYRPRSFYAGLSITSVSLLLGVAAIIWGWRGSRGGGGR